MLLLSPGGREGVNVNVEYSYPLYERTTKKNHRLRVHSGHPGLGYISQASLDGRQMAIENSVSNEFYLCTSIILTFLIAAYAM